MQNRLKVLFVLAVGTATSFALSESPQISWTVRDAVNFYNNGSNTDYLFKLVETDPMYGLDESLRPQQLQFKLKETECLKSEKKNIEDCDFQETGTMKVCSAILLVDLERNAIVINCDSAIPEHVRVRRFLNLFKKKKKHRPGRFSSIAYGKNGSKGSGIIWVK